MSRIHDFHLKIARTTVELLLPIIKVPMDAGVFKRKHLHIVIGDPVVKPWEVRCFKEWLTKGVLYEHSIGERGEWEHPYDEIARKKAWLSFRHGLPTQVIQARYPYLLDDGDTIYYGSAVDGHFAIAASGVEPWFDQMISEWLMSAFRAHMYHARERGELPLLEGGAFVG